MGKHISHIKSNLTVNSYVSKETGAVVSPEYYNNVLHGDEQSKFELTTSPKLPTPGQLADGEIAINYAADYETISLKNNLSDIVTFKPDTYNSEKYATNAYVRENLGEIIANKDGLAAIAEAEGDNGVLTKTTNGGTSTWSYTEQLYAQGTAQDLNAGTDTNGKVWGAKTIADYVQDNTTAAVKFKGGFNAGTGVIDGGSTTLTSVAEKVGDMYTVTTAGTFVSTAMEVGDSIVFKKAVANNTAPTANDVVFVEGTVSVTNTGYTLNWNTGVTVATVEGVNITAKLPANPNTDTKVTSVDNHYAPATVSGQDKSASASGGTAGWSVDVVKGVTLNTDGKGHVTGLSVTSAKIPANPVSPNTVTGTGLTADKIVVGGGNSTVATSGKGITATAPSSSSDDTTVPTSKAVWTAVSNGIATADAMIYKGTVAGGSTGAYGALTPAANKGWTYKVATAGKIDGKAVEVGDMLICNTDGTAAATSSNYSTIVANWDFIQVNIDGAVTGPASSTDAHVAVFNGATGKVVKDSGFTIAASVPSNAAFTDTKVTSVGNHYAPAEDTSSQLDADASSTTAATWNSTSLVTGVTVKRDAKGHVVGLGVDSIKMPANPNTDTKVTSVDNHYAPATVSGQDKSASASGGTAGWSVDVVKGVTLNTDGKGHVTGLSVTSAKIPANPVSPNTVTGPASSTDAHVAVFNGATGKAIKDSGFTIAKSVPSDAVFTDTSVTSVGNHYAPAEDTSSQLDADASSTTAATWNSTSLVTGVTVKRDAKGHVVGLGVDSIKMPANPNTDTKVTSVDNHYAPATVSGQDKSASASGGTAGWSVDVVKGVTLNTDGKGHVTGLSVTSAKIPANPVSPNTVTGPASSTDAHVAVFNGATGKVVKDSGFTIAKSVPSNAVFTDTHYVTHLYAGSGTAANAATTNGNTKLTVVDDSTVRNSVTIKGSGGTTVTSDASGVVTIDSTDVSYKQFTFTSPTRSDDGYYFIISPKGNATTTPGGTCYFVEITALINNSQSRYVTRSAKFMTHCYWFAQNAGLRITDPVYESGNASDCPILYHNQAVGTDVGTETYYYNVCNIPFKLPIETGLMSVNIKVQGPDVSKCTCSQSMTSFKWSTVEPDWGAI